MIVSSTDSLEFVRVGTGGIKIVFTAPFDCVLYARFTSGLPFGGALWTETSFGARITNIVLSGNLEHNNVFLSQGHHVSEENFAGVSYELFFVRVD